MGPGIGLCCVVFRLCCGKIVLWLSRVALLMRCVMLCSGWCLGKNSRCGCGVRIPV